MQVADGRMAKGKELLYHGTQPLCYGADPVEHVAYIGCHDNETMFDQVGMVGGGGGMFDHVRMSAVVCLTRCAWVRQCV